MKPDSVFQEQIIQYLESCHIGEFNTGTLEEVRDKVIKKEKSKDYKNLTETLPIPVLSKCKLNCNKCNQCVENKIWWENLPEIIDDIISKLNIHKYNKKCMNNKYNSYRARFPRDIVKETKVNLSDKSIKIKKLEEWINFITPILIYLLGCNSDVTSLLSGTAIKAIVAYVTDYITKVPLKTHVMFDTIRNVFDKKLVILN